MTRFARAKGSKASNLKAPDDSTPWEVMKEQLLQAKKENEENKNRQQAENQRIENYSNFLKEQKVLKRKATWCEFPGSNTSNKKNESNPDEVNMVKKKKKQNLANADNNSEPSHVVDSTKEIKNNESNNDVTSKKLKKKKKKNSYKCEGIDNNTEEIEANKIPIQCPQPDKINKKKKKKLNMDTSDNSASNMHTNEVSENKIQIQSPQKDKGNKKKKKKHNEETSDNKVTTMVTKQINKEQNGAQKQKSKKKKGDQPTRRKEINDRSFQLIINGKEVELVRFDGFPIMKKDAERLNELKTSMMKKGIPKSEVNRTIKLERRRAEKALARLKRDVCYNCRKGGHNLSDCPDLKSNIPGVDAADGLCFKCGSTEHRQFECKVQRDKEFRFANCFICKEQGHIARQCPDNPKGLYPNGGSCKLCGDVTHLRKDCPTVQNKEEKSIKLQTLDNANNIEDIEIKVKPTSEEAPRKPKKIKF